ncbi:hypothetical protein AMTR_s00150p00092730 [Amborella trichopoda]|uniref:Uncharacterized protein n=1 Tax=Amborella trichopoda TaxID=13333 RepID=W1PKB0_AMBTC|nr:hypothetical protein AMTR_s00150p00092730 [Amborella trichopoda]
MFLPNQPHYQSVVQRKENCHSTIVDDNSPSFGCDRYVTVISANMERNEDEDGLVTKIDAHLLSQQQVIANNIAMPLITKLLNKYEPFTGH